MRYFVVGIPETPEEAPTYVRHQDGVEEFKEYCVANGFPYREPDVLNERMCAHNKDRKIQGKWTNDGHCHIMTCPNYSETCPVHAIAKTGETCSLKR
jgi:hypothetical protein